MKYIYLSSLIFFFHCSFADLDRGLIKNPEASANYKLFKNVTILNHIRLYNGQTSRGYRDFGPVSYQTYLSEKQKEIGKARYQWKDIYVYDVNDSKFQFTDIKTDFVLFVSTNRAISDWEGEEWKHIFQVVTLCVIPCTQKISLDVSVKLYYKNGLVSEKVSHLAAIRYMSPWYLPVPFLFQMRDYGILFNEPSVFSILYLNSFQEAIDEIYLNLPDELAKETKSVP